MNVSSNGDTIIITDMNLNALTSNSILRVREITSGTYQYICTSVLQFPDVQDNIIGFSSANVIVRGRTASMYTDSLPKQGMNVVIDILLNIVTKSVILTQFCSIQKNGGEYGQLFFMSQLLRLQNNLPMSEWSMCLPVLLPYSGLWLSSHTLGSSTRFSLDSDKISLIKLALQ